MLVVTAFWLLGLGATCLLTANPVTLNRQQILAAFDVVKAEVLEPRSGTVRIISVSKNKLLAEQQRLTIANLEQVGVRAGQVLLIPIVQLRDQWHVAASKLPGQLPLVYPATAESEQQLAGILEVDRRR